MSELSNDTGPETQTQAMCKAWRLFKVHGREASTLVHREMARCQQAGDHDGAAGWQQVAEALGEWCD